MTKYIDIAVVCPVCGEDMEDDVLDHDYRDENGDSIFTCDKCGSSVNEYNAHYEERMRP